MTMTLCNLDRNDNLGDRCYPEAYRLLENDNFIIQDMIILLAGS